MKAWHWTADTLRNGAPIPAVGEWLEHDGPVEMCVSGLHASRRVLDALCYAPGPIVHRVECEQIEGEQEDKLVCRRRRILWTVDAEEILHDFARRCALDVIHLWDAPDVVVRYLTTGDESIRDAAWDAAWAAARNAAQAGARAAAWDAAWAAAQAAARAAAWNAAWNAAQAGARATQNRRLTQMIVRAR